jgi:hypothetical protein
VWVQSDGRAQLADTALSEAAAPPPGRAGETEVDRSLALLRQVAVLALEARSRQPGDPPMSLQASLPEPARPVLDRLLGSAPGYETVENFQADLAATPES